MPAGREFRIVVQGNCMGLSLSDVIRHLVATLDGGKGFQVRHVHNTGFPNGPERDLPGHVLEFIRTCDVFVEQIDSGDSQSIAALVPASAARLRFPAVRMKWLWPFATVVHPRHKAIEPHLPYGIYGVSGSDAILNRVMKSEPDPDIALAKFLEIDPTQRIDLGRVFELTREKILAIEQGCDFFVWDRMERSFRDRPLFWYEAHPNWDFFQTICSDVLRALPVGAAEINVQVALQRYGATHPFENWQAPIHPRVAEYFELKWFDPNTRYKRDVEGWFGYIDYLQRYIRYDFDEQWHIGRWHSTARDGNPAIGEQALRDALTRRPDNGAGAFVLAQNLWRQNRAEDALGAIDIALRDPDASRDDRVHSLHGGILGRLGRLPEAIEAYRRAIALRPGFAQFHWQLGNALMTLREPFDTVLAVLQRAVELDPFAARFRTTLARHLYRGRRLDEARAQFERALALADFDARLMDRVADKLAEAGWSAEAIYVSKRIAEATGRAADWQAFAEMARRLGALDEAATGYRRLVTLRPDDADAWLALSQTAAALGAREEALDAAYRAVDQAPERQDMHPHLAAAYLELRRAGGAAPAPPASPLVPAAPAGRTEAREPGPLRVISGEDAYASLRQNKRFRWAQHKSDGTPAPSRTRQTLFLPAVRPKFNISLDDTIFTIGSCFARHVEAHLEKFGYRFPTRDAALHLGPDEATSPSGFYNKYTTHSMLNEVRFALGDATLPDAAYFADGAGRWHDGQMPANFASKERAIAVRRNVERVTAHIATAGVLVVTLGLVEAWYDGATGEYLNITPQASAIKAHPGRFAVHVLDYETNLRCLTRLHDLVRAHNPRLRMIVTVSPVPLGATFTGQDIAVANLFSKSTLRAVAGDFAGARENVDYFPSYEAVTESDPTGAWMDDMIHVNSEMVDCVISYFMKKYLAEPEASTVDLEAPTRRLRAFIERRLEAELV